MDLTGYVMTTVLSLVFGPLAEREFGAPRTAVIFLASHVIGVFLGHGVVLLGRSLPATVDLPARSAREVRPGGGVRTAT